MANWSMLLTDLLCEIALKLDVPEDFVYFSAACHSWYHAYCTVKPRWIVNNSKTPWLLLGEPSKKNSGVYTRKFFSIGENKCIEYDLPETFGARCWGSSFGWIVMLHLDQQIQLFNPVTKTRLSLPPLHTMPGYPNDEDDDGAGAGDDYDDSEAERYEDWWFQKSFMTRFVVLKVPLNDNVDEFEFVVMAIHWHWDELAFACPGDQVWTPVHTTCTRPLQVCDVFRWGKLILILYKDGTLAYCDISNRNLSPTPVKAKDYVPAPSDIFTTVVAGLGALYMAELGGDLLVISRIKVDTLDHNGEVSYCTLGFKVHKLDDKSKLWEEVEDLGEYLLFVGNNTALSVHILNSPNCQKNAIYFTDDETQFWDNESIRGHDMGVYDMVSKTFHPFYEGDDTLSKCSPPIWLVPQF